MKDKEKEKGKRRREEEEEDDKEKSLSTQGGGDELSKAMAELDEVSGVKKPVVTKSKRAPNIVEKALGAFSDLVGILKKSDYSFENPVMSYMGEDSDDDDTDPDKGARNKDRGQETMESERQTAQEAADEDEDDNEARMTIVTGQTKRGRAENDTGRGGKGAFGARRTGLPDQTMRSRGGNERDEDEISKGHQQAMYEQLSEDENFSEIVEASPALARLTDVIVKSHGILMARVMKLSKSQKRLRAENAELRAGLAKSLSTQAKLIKSLSGGYNSNGHGSPGVIAMINGQPRQLNGVGNADPMALRKGMSPEEAQLIKSRNEDAINVAINDGALDPDVHAIYASTGRLDGIPPHVATKYGITILQ